MRTDRKRKTNNEGHKERNQGRQLTYSPFAAEDFNFTRVKDDEIIGTLGAGAHALLVNVSPLAYGHCLLCPEYKACRPQILTLDALEVAIAFASAADPERDDMKVTFNSLGAWASVNHLHFHVFWPSGRQDREPPSEPEATERVLDSRGCMIPLREPAFGRMPIELAEPKRILATTSSLKLEEIDYPAYTFRLTAVDGGSERPMAAGLWSIVSVLLKLDIPHNILICQRGEVAFITPRQPQMVTRLDEDTPEGGGLHIACAELGGYMICFDQRTYDRLVEADVCRLFLRDIHFSDTDMIAESAFPHTMADQVAINNELESMRRAILHLQQENRLLKEQLHRTRSPSISSPTHGSAGEPSDPPFDMRRRSLELINELDNLERELQSTSDRLVNHRISGIRAILERHQSIDESETVTRELARRRSSVLSPYMASAVEEEEENLSEDQEPKFDMRRLSRNLEAEVQALRAITGEVEDRLLNQRLSGCEQVLARQQEIEDTVREGGRPKGCFLTRPIMNVHS
ncbi:GDP-D-glucose phosphorylase [Perkinsus olseni]|uniref:GDP-D-glucose phosphorylase 1 n=1 Tax=Perkinsus olseni TaxID=32597 RepID=A0A7J6PGK8_PEROL|nr:GDP-D-glucose phosphorylase [Perkinsus olseni]